MDLLSQEELINCLIKGWYRDVSALTWLGKHRIMAIPGAAFLGIPIGNLFRLHCSSCLVQSPRFSLYGK